VVFEIIKNYPFHLLKYFRLRELPVSIVFIKISIKELLAPITSSTPQRTSSFHERTDKEPVVLLALV
jgi:hypothetical protein